MFVFPASHHCHLFSSALPGGNVAGTVTFPFSAGPWSTRMIRDNTGTTQYVMQCSSRNTSLCSLCIFYTNLMNILPDDSCKCSQGSNHQASSCLVPLALLKRDGSKSAPIYCPRTTFTNFAVVCCALTSCKNRKMSQLLTLCKFPESMLHTSELLLYKTQGWRCVFR